jgi:3-hydroxy-9,10-secoandrosta-1,3,5(10)-triene-9,17-dione monooxygenase reductase component
MTEAFDEVRASEPVLAAQAPGPDLFRSVLGYFPTGVAVMTSTDGGLPIGMTVQSLCSLSLDPPKILVCPARSSTTWPRIERRGGLCVNLLAEDQADLARRFARSGTDKFQGVEWSRSTHTGSPILVGSLAWIDCWVAAQHPGGDHQIVVCDVIALGAHADQRALVFWHSAFKRIL